MAQELLKWSKSPDDFKVHFDTYLRTIMESYNVISIVPVEFYGSNYQELIKAIIVVERKDSDFGRPA